MSSENLITSIYKWEELDLDDLAEFSFKARQSRPETYDSQRTVERERNIINHISEFSPSYVLIAQKGKEKLGWVSFDFKSTSILEIGRWLPIILLEKYENQVITCLIEECKKYCKRIDYPRIEVSFSIKDKGEKRAYEIYKKWYEANDMQFKDEISYMNRNLSDSDITEIKIPETFEIKSIMEIGDDKLYQCYYEVFIQAQNRMFQDQTEQERQEYFQDYYSKSKPLIKEASLVLKKTESNEIIGVTLVRPREEDAHLALLIIHPKFQGRKLGGLLLRLIMKMVLQQGFKTMSLGVDIENSAMKIYQYFGFKSNSHIITHCWKVYQEL